MSTTVTAILLGVLEGLTEFIPVSSTGHLVLAERFLGYDPKPWEVFTIVIQLPAILAVVVAYWRTIWAVIQGCLKRERHAIAFVANVLLGFIPAAILGVLLKKKIDALLETPIVIAWALLLGGIAILIIERLARPAREHAIGDLRPGTAFGVGLMQCLAMIPGVSRSGATIMGALAMGVPRRTAAEFSFFLAIPTMFGATAKQLWDHRHELAAGTGQIGWSEIGLGSIVSFVVALAVIRPFVNYVGRSGFGPFAVYRIIAGAVAIGLLLRAG
ncbi:MAG: undecaprenyl-diphosphate phosphatase [Sphingomonadales bacterium]|nr:undecaprenyl-diphosphate phosphatase [Sphingomonadales bacterium]